MSPNPTDEELAKAARGECLTLPALEAIYYKLEVEDQRLISMIMHSMLESSEKSLLTIIQEVLGNKNKIDIQIAIEALGQHKS